MRVVKSKKGSSIKILKELRETASLVAEVGHFEPSPQHGRDNISHTDLLNIWSVGLAKGNEGIIKNPLLSFIFSKLQSKELPLSPEFKKIIMKWSKGLEKGNSSRTFAMDMAQLLKKEYEDIYGEVGEFMPTDADGTPMLESGDLRGAIESKVRSK